MTDLAHYLRARLADEPGWEIVEKDDQMLLVRRAVSLVAGTSIGISTTKEVSNED